MRGLGGGTRVWNTVRLGGVRLGGYLGEETWGVTGG